MLRITKSGDNLPEQDLVFKENSMAKQLSTSVATLTKSVSLMQQAQTQRITPKVNSFEQECSKVLQQLDSLRSMASKPFALPTTLPAMPFSANPLTVFNFDHSIPRQ